MGSRADAAEESTAENNTIGDSPDSNLAAEAQLRNDEVATTSGEACLRPSEHAVTTGITGTYGSPSSDRHRDFRTPFSAAAITVPSD